MQITIFEMMLKVKNCNVRFYYHKDTGTFDDFPVSPIELEHIDYHAKITDNYGNNVPFPSYEEIDHKEIMRCFVRDCVDDKESRRQLFNVLRRDDYVDLFIEKLKELDLYEDFEMACGDIYYQIFYEWAEENDLHW